MAGPSYLFVPVPLFTFSFALTLLNCLTLIFITLSMKLSLVSLPLLCKLLVWALYTSGVFCQSFSPPTDDICPGDNVTFTCVIVDDGTRFTRWTVTPGGADPRCTVEHPDPLTESCGPMNSFTSSLTGSSGTSYTSTLSVESIPDSLNGTIVECTNSTGSTIGSDVICIVGDVVVFPELIDATVSERDVGADECVLSVRWSEAVISCGGSVTQYVLSVTPCQSNCDFTTLETQMNLNVAINRPYDLAITVMAKDKCGNMLENETDPVTITLSDGTKNCNATSVYDNSTGVLIEVTATWEEFILHVDGLPGKNVSYDISLDDTLYNNTNTLNYTFNIPDPIDEYRPMIKASSPCASKMSCSPQQIYTEMEDFCEYLGVNETDLTKATIFCSDPTQAAWQCTARCGTSPSLMDLTINGSDSAPAGGHNITIQLPQLTNRTYDCVVSAILDNGTILCRERLQFNTTGCLPSDLLQISSGPECLTTVNGDCTEFVICSDGDEKCAMYNGTSEDSRAVYTSSTDYCLKNGSLERFCMDGGHEEDDEWTGEEPDIEEVTMETKLEDWNIALIVIGVTVYIIGVCVATVLGTLLFLRASSCSDGVLAVVVLVASGLLFPLAAVLYFVMKKKELDEKRLDLKRWYKILMVASVVITVICLIMWLVLIGYVASHDFYDEGYRRGDNSECVSTDGNEAEKRVRNGLVIACFVLSLLVVVEWSVCAALWRCGVVDGSDSPDGAPPKPRRSKKSKKDEAEQELETYETLQHAHKQPSSPQPLLSAGDPTYGRLNAQQQQQEDEQQYDHVQREKKKAVPNVNDPNYSHFASGGEGGQHYGKLDHGTGTGKGGTLPGSVPPTADEYGKLDKSRGGGEEYAVVTNEARHKPKKTGH